MNLTGSVTGGNENSGYHLDKDGSGYIVSNKGYGIYFDPGFYPIYISNPAFKNSPSNAPFSVDKQGNVNLQGSNVNIDTGNVNITGIGGVNISEGNKYININSEGITLNGDITFTNSNFPDTYATKDYADKAASDAASNALGNIPQYELNADKILAALADIDQQGLFYKNNGQLYINATGLKAQYLESDVIDVHGALRTRDYEFNSVTGRLGSGSGQADNDTKTYGVGMAADPLYSSQLGPKDIPARWENGQIVEYLGGGYAFVTDSGARIGYFSKNKNHTALVVSEGKVSVQYLENGNEVKKTTLWSKS